MLAQLKRGIRMVGQALVVLRHNPKLLVFPLIAGISSLLFLGLLLGSTFGVLVGIEGLEAFETRSGFLATISGNPVVTVPALFLGYLGTTFVSVFFTGALVAESRYALADEPVNLRRGMARAWTAKYDLLAWAVIAATVGIIIDAIESSDNPVSKVFTVVFGAVWTVMTFFIVPVAVLDPQQSLRGMFRRSGQVFRENVGETVIGLGAPRAVGFGIFVLANLLAFGLSEITPSPLVYAPILVAGAVLSQLVSTTLRGILKTVVYVYATAGRMPAEFDAGDLDPLLS
ncbi:DUF6159 family protein [Haloarcula salinisoli]|uniref:Membrane domain of glycerophosphoryl diester phosphodiesterase n=1 Tax=Haloarcula salinisoli TaxID=2487746 RepID=A0A8J7YJY5_9EURY|nr:DUF6159 family protein [Halomicroarcula salinisoli]MBX0287757.1 hypothetical protein [Halomicroarcula salinisoli]MBX0304681.1 hypothetical protein [Halomicroarcula salinisoli]